MPSAHVFIASSLDGYIAREDGGLDWLPAAGDEDFGYRDFIAGIDAIVMGRHTFDTTRGFVPWPHDRPVVVLSRQLAGTDVPALLKGQVEFSALTPTALMASLAERGISRVYIDGGQLIQSFLREQLIDDIVVTTIPVLLGGGRRLFGPLAGDVRLHLTASRAIRSHGLVQSTYRVLR